MANQPTAMINPFTGQRVGTFNPYSGKGFSSKVTVRPVLNPEMMHSQYGMTYKPGFWGQFKRSLPFYGKYLSSPSPGRMDQRSGFGDTGLGNKDYLDYLNGLNSAGYSWKGYDGNDVTVSPETIELFKAMSPYMDESFASPEAKEAAIVGNVQNLFKSRGTMEAIRGFGGYNDNLQTGINNWNMRAMQLLSSSNPSERLEGEKMMNIGARAQEIFNKAQPQVTQALQARIQPYKDFFSNNWWWMIPGGLLALGGIGSLLTGRGQEEQPDAQQAGWPFAKGAPSQQNLPPGWTSGIIPEAPQSPAMGV